MISKKNKQSPSIIHLKISDLQVMDILLFKNAGKKAFAITSITSQCYSHAAIVISPTVWFEATLSGNMFSPVPDISVVNNANENLIIGTLEGVESISVLRHPELIRASAKKLNNYENKILSTTATLNVIGYPRIYELFPVIISSFFGLEINSVLKQKNLPSMFCSEVVASILLQTDLDPFDGKKQPIHTTPGDFINSKLEDITKNIVVENPDYYPNQVDSNLLDCSLHSLYASIYSYEERQKMFTNVYKLIVEIHKTKSDAKTRNLAEESVRETIKLIQSHELKAIKDHMKREKLIIERKKDSSLSFLSNNPKTVFSQKRQEQPQTSSFLRPIVEHLNRVGVDWDKLAQEISD